MDQEKGRDFRRKKFPILREREDKPIKRPIILMKSKDHEKTGGNKNDDISVPTILLKARDGENRAISPQTSSVTKSSKESDGGPSYQLAPRVPVPDLSNVLCGPPVMKQSVKLLDDETQVIQDSFLEFLTDSTDFLVVGCIGLQGVGKSTLLSHFAKLPNDPFLFENFVFKKQSKTDIDSSTHCTVGIDAYITSERVVLLDCQPVNSLSILGKHYNCEGNLSARSCSRDDPDYPCMESDMELLSLQYTAFLLTVCHVVIVMQDFAIDTELIRLLLTAEMLKPSTGVHSDEDTLVEYFPQIMLLHNKIDVKVFKKKIIHSLQESYKEIFKESQLPIQSGIGIANGNVLKSLTPELCNSEPINMFLLPKFQKEIPIYESVNYITLIEDLRLQIYGTAPAPLTHTLLTEKNWWHYAAKIWDDIKKSSFFPEFGRIIPTPSSAKAELNQT